MEYIDFTKSKDNIIYQLLHSSDNLETTNSYALFDYYKYLHFFRHNYLHYLVLKALGETWIEERTIQSFFPNLMIPETIALKTPDIFILKNDTYYLIDVSISIDIHKISKIKDLKYEPIEKWLCENNHKTRYIHINVKQNYTNIQQELEKIKNILKHEFDYNSFFRVLDIIEDKKSFVNANIDKEIFNELKIKEYNHLNKKENLEEKETLFMDELKFENIGIYKDLNIETKTFESYNNKYKLLSNVEKSFEEFDEQKWIDYLKEILENENNPIHKKYKDEKMSKDQFLDAYNKIENKNKTYQKRVPKTNPSFDDTICRRFGNI